MIYDIEKLKYKKSTDSENEPAIKEFYEYNSRIEKRATINSVSVGWHE
jgi:hypothetical protein